MNSNGMSLNSWDYENRMTEAATRRTKTRYKYDALGRRVQRFQTGGTENTKFTYDGLDVLVDDNAGTLTKYLNGPGIDNKLRATTGSTTSYFLADHLGSTNGLADSTGAVTASNSYDSFGNPSNTSFPSRYQFTGRELDPFTGLHYYRARWYDSNLGRFISEDPAGFADSTNLYSYVGNRPIHFTDPLGLFPSKWRWRMHQEINSVALAGLATQEQIDAINQSTESFDSRTQDPIYAPYHAMNRMGGQSVGDARAEANDFVWRKICLARNYAGRGLNLSAMEQLGQATHTMQDFVSPSHSGFQTAWPNTRFFTFINGWHYVRETFFPGEENKIAAQQNTQRVWRYFAGEPMPGDLFSNSGPQRTCECP
jgi:RHS repeat-associated protein